MRHTPGFIWTLLILVSGTTLCAVVIPRTSPGSPAATSFARPSFIGVVQQTGGAITKANWRGHPKIKSIRALVQSVNNGMNRKSFAVRKRVFEYCEPYEDTERVIGRDSHGRTRFYKNQGGSEDSSLKWEHYYDDAGHLRFVFITGGAVNGSQLEHRIYFDETGKRIWEEQTYKKGPGYTFPTEWPDEQLQITDPMGKFLSDSRCAEVTQKSGKQKGSGN